MQCVKSLRKVFTQKGDINGKVINKHNMVVKEVIDVSYGIEADIEVSVGKIKGLTKVKIWGPSKSVTKKNQCTIIISKYNKNCDPKFTTMMSRKIIKPLLESYLKGQGWKEMIQPLNNTNKDRIKCTDCDKSFGKRYIKTHAKNMHSNNCKVCKTTFKSADQLKKHKVQIHSNAPKDSHNKLV